LGSEWDIQPKEYLLVNPNRLMNQFWDIRLSRPMSFGSSTRHLYPITAVIGLSVKWKP